MAIAITWDVTHICKHTVTHDLSHKRPDERAGFARWLADRDCTDCWRNDPGRDNDAWSAKRRADEQEAAVAWARQFAMPALDGSPKAVAWANRCRHQLVVAAHTALVLDGVLTDAGWADIEDAARTVTRAGWWIDNRETDPADLPELLAAATQSDCPTENHY